MHGFQDVIPAANGIAVFLKRASCIIFFIGPGLGVSTAQKLFLNSLGLIGITYCLTARMLLASL